MDERLRKALDTEAQQKIAAAVAEFPARLAALDAKLDRVIELLASAPAPTPNKQGKP